MQAGSRNRWRAPRESAYHRTKRGILMNIKPKCSCSGSSDLMFSCSGAADVAEIGDRAVRRLHQAGEAKMFCLAGISGKVELIEVSARGAARRLVVDGCDSDCAKKTMELAGFADFSHFRVTDLGMEKGKSQVSEERIELVAAKLRELLQNPAEPAQA
jgi:uncharacterized metal-binding protein